MSWVPVILGWIIAGASGLRSLAQAVANALASFWQNLVAIWARWVDAANYAMGGAVWLWDGFLKFVIALHAWLVWLVVIKLPTMALGAEQYAVGVGQSILDQAVRYVSGWVDYLDNEIRSLVQGVEDQAAAWFNELRGNLADAIQLLDDVARRVYALLTNPRALADWVAGEIIGAAFRWVMANAEALARLAFAHILAATLTGIGVAEQILVDMFL